MHLLQKEEIEAKRKNNARELTIKTEKLVSSYKKVLALQNDIHFDADKAKKIRDYEIWCADLQVKQSKELERLKVYEKLVEDTKEDYYQRLGLKDALDEKIFNLKEEITKLDLQIKWKQEVLK